MGLRHHGPNQNLTRCSTRPLIIIHRIIYYFLYLFFLYLFLLQQVGRPPPLIWGEAICTVLQQVGSQILGLRHHGPNQNLTRCSTRALNGSEGDIAPGVEDPPLKVQTIGITQHNIIRFRVFMIESIRQLQINVRSLSDQSFTTFSELQKKIRRPQRFER